MTRNCIILLLFTISLSVIAADSSKQIKPRLTRNLSARLNSQTQAFPSEISNETLSREQQLIFGLVVLNKRHPIFNNNGYSYYLKELLNVTGYSASEAKDIIEIYTSNPDKYLLVLEKIKQKLAGNYE